MLLWRFRWKFYLMCMSSLIHKRCCMIDKRYGSAGESSTVFLMSSKHSLMSSSSSRMLSNLWANSSKSASRSSLKTFNWVWRSSDGFCCRVYNVDKVNVASRNELICKRPFDILVTLVTLTQNEIKVSNTFKADVLKYYNWFSRNISYQT